MNTRETIRGFILEDLGWQGSPAELTDDLPLLDAHVLDSLDMLRLVSLIEEKLGVQVRDEDLVLDNFGSIERITGFVDSRRS
jgi:acyl carrier protein